MFRLISIGLFITTNAFGQEDTLSVKEYLFPSSFQIVQHTITTRTDFYLLEFECTGGAFLNPADTCFERTSYVMTTKSNSRIDLTKYNICQQFDSRIIHSDQLIFFEKNKDKIKKEEFKINVTTSHDCGIWFYEFKNRKLKAVLHFSDYMTEKNEQYEDFNKGLLTYKLLVGLRDELKSLDR